LRIFGYHQRETQHEATSEMDAPYFFSFMHYYEYVLTRWDVIAGTVAFAAVPVSARVISIAARHIITDLGTYYAVSIIYLAA
jgi:hypothetical protein